MVADNEDKSELQQRAESIATAPLAQGAEGHTQLLMLLIFEQGGQMRADAADHRSNHAQLSAMVDILHDRMNNFYHWLIGLPRGVIIGIIVTMFKDEIIGMFR